MQLSIRLGTLGLTLVTSLVFAPDAHAAASFARQTQLDCNACHIGHDSTPLFTPLGRSFAMQGYGLPNSKPVMFRRKAAPSSDEKEEETKPSSFGGDYLALNLDEYLSARFVSDLIDTGGEGTRINPTGRLALFYTGPITEWLGLWTEIGYLGNNALPSVSQDNAGATTGLNFFAFDEFRLVATRRLESGRLLGAALSNEHPNVIGQFNFPSNLPDMWFAGQGGTGRALQIGSVSLYSLTEKLWAQYGLVTGQSNQRIDDGANHYINLAFNNVVPWVTAPGKESWLAVELYGGDDGLPMVNPTRTSFLCTEPDCPDGVSDAALGFDTFVGFTPGAVDDEELSERVDNFASFKLTLHQAVQALGRHRWYAAANIHGMQQDYESGAEAQRLMAGAMWRYYLDRTWGFEISAYTDLDYTYTTPAGVEREIHSQIAGSFTLLMQLAMNVSLHAGYRTDTRHTFDPDANGGTRDSFRLGLDYNF